LCEDPAQLWSGNQERIAVFTLQLKYLPGEDAKEHYKTQMVVGLK
jgi:hypothetical protein